MGVNHCFIKGNFVKASCPQNDPTLWLEKVSPAGFISRHRVLDSTVTQCTKPRHILQSSPPTTVILLLPSSLISFSIFHIHIHIHTRRTRQVNHNKQQTSQELKQMQCSSIFSTPSPQNTLPNELFSPLFEKRPSIVIFRRRWHYFCKD